MGAGPSAARPEAADRERPQAEPAIIELRNIVKRFGNVDALAGVSLTIHRAEVVGLLGDNGAGKSTLIKTLAGVHQPDSGEIIVKGVRRKAWTPKAARDAGIETVFQDRALAPQHSIAVNIFMGREIIDWLGFTRGRAQIREAGRLMREIGFTSKAFDPESVVGHLSGGERQGVAIARALYHDADVIVLDEPTTALSLTETQKIFGFVRSAKSRGRSVVFIGHNIYHAWDIADRFVVVDRGRKAFDSPRSAFQSAEHLISEMHRLAAPGLTAGGGRLAGRAE